MSETKQKRIIIKITSTRSIWDQNFNKKTLIIYSKVRVLNLILEKLTVEEENSPINTRQSLENENRCHSTKHELVDINM